jgi:acylphosphatase
MIRYRIIFSGRVQRVGFRNFVAKNAAKAGLTGYVKNLADGRVEMVIQGKCDAKIASFLRVVRLGNGISKVLSYDIEQVASDETETAFEIY